MVPFFLSSRKCTEALMDSADGQCPPLIYHVDRKLFPRLFFFFFFSRGDPGEAYCRGAREGQDVHAKLDMRRM